MAERCAVLIVGAGIHGAGVAQAAAAAGHDTLLVEQYGAPAQGTSGRSSKLIHGGLRYLEGGHFGLVRESLRERALLLRNAPGLVRLVPLNLPVYGRGRRGPAWIRAGLSLYALIGGLRRENRFRALAPLPALDGLRREGLRVVFRYLEARTDDAALTRAVLASASSLGARLRYGARLATIELDSEGGRARLAGDGGEETIAFGVAVNAAGPWASGLLERVSPRPPQAEVELVRGTHIVVPGELREGAYYVESPRDGRAVFVLPWRGATLVGTTEAAYQGDPGAVAAAEEEIDYLLEVYGRHFPDRPAGRADVLEAFAGLRVLPLGGHAFSARSRETRLHLDRARRPRLVTVLGGKLTTYRATAERVLAAIVPSLPAARPRADTHGLALAAEEESAV